MLNTVKSPEICPVNAYNAHCDKVCDALHDKADEDENHERCDNNYCSTANACKCSTAEPTRCSTQTQFNDALTLECSVWSDNNHNKCNSLCNQYELEHGELHVCGSTACKNKSEQCCNNDIALCENPNSILKYLEDNDCYEEIIPSL